MEFGFNRFDMRSVSGFGASVARGEALGFDIAFIPSSPLLARDPYVMLASAAAETSRIRLAPMLENPITRHPAVLAGSIATVAEVSDGRAELAMGVGDTAVRTLGLRPAKVARLERSVTIVRDLLAGERVDFDGRSSRLRHAHHTPVHVAAGGPKTLQMAGRIADGVIIRVGTHRDNIDHAIQQVHEGARQAGRNPASIAITAVFHAILNDNSDIQGKIGRSIAAGYFEYAPYLFERIGCRWDGPPVEALRPHIWQDFHHTPDLTKAGELVDFLSDDTMASFCLHGSADDMLDQLRGIADRHPAIRRVCAHPMTPPPASKTDYPHLDFMEAFAGGVIARWRQDTAIA